MVLRYILIYPCSYHGNGIYLENVPIVPFDVRCQSGIYPGYTMPGQQNLLVIPPLGNRYGEICRLYHS